MPIQYDEEQRIARLRADLLVLGFEWNEHYHLFDDGKRWGLEYFSFPTVAQRQQIEEVLERTMNT